jgi:hypothetical protein
MKSSQTNALWFLWSRQVVNGIRRALTSPKRLISVLVALGYYVSVFIRPWDKSMDSFGSGKNKLPPIGAIQNIDPNLVSAIVFSVFVIASIVLSGGALATRNTFKPADVDVLFPTPISTKVVMIFRIFRDYFATLLLPVFFAIMLYRPVKIPFTKFKNADPAGFASILRGSVIAWLLLSLAWIGIGYAVSFYAAKNEKRALLFSRVINWSLIGTICIVFGYMSLALRNKPEMATFISVTQTPWLRALMFIPSAASELALGGYTGSLFKSLLGGGILVGVFGASLYFASGLSAWMYDQAATKGFQAQTMRDLMRKGDSTAMVAERARSGQVKQGRIARKFALLTFRGGWSLVYKEWLMQSRMNLFMTVFMTIMVAGISIVFLSIPGKRSGPSPALFYFAFTSLFCVVMSAGTAANGFMETLRRVEVIKPLPLSSAQIAFYETAAKASVSMFVAIVPFVCGFIYKPVFWQYHLAGMITAPVAALALVAVTFLVMVLFPDFEDPTQRSFRGLMSLLGMVITLSPSFGVFVLFIVILKTSILIPALLCVPINIGFTVLAATFAGRFYSDFNPSE